MKDFIAYSVKNGIKYATLCHPVQDADGKWVKTYSNLGRVLNEEAGIYQSRERGVFSFNMETHEYGRCQRV